MFEINLKPEKRLELRINFKHLFTMSRAHMGEPDEYMESLTGAHSHFHKFAFGYVPK